MSALGVEFGAAEASRAQLMQARVAIAAQLSGLEATAARLSGRWSGEAQQAYAIAQAEWSQSMAEMVAVLDAATALLESWTSRMTQLESDLAAGWPS